MFEELEAVVMGCARCRFRKSCRGMGWRCGWFLIAAMTHASFICSSPSLLVSACRVEVTSGYRMPCPEFCERKMYDNIMLACWAADPHERPSFKKLVEFLSPTALLSSASQGLLAKPIELVGCDWGT